MNFTPKQFKLFRTILTLVIVTLVIFAREITDVLHVPYVAEVLVVILFCFSMIMSLIEYRFGPYYSLHTVGVESLSLEKLSDKSPRMISKTEIQKVETTKDERRTRRNHPALLVTLTLSSGDVVILPMEKSAYEAMANQCAAYKYPAFVSIMPQTMPEAIVQSIQQNMPKSVETEAPPGMIDTSDPLAQEVNPAKGIIVAVLLVGGIAAYIAYYLGYLRF